MGRTLTKLNIREAIRLYVTIRPHLPDEPKPESFILDYVKVVISSMKHKDPYAYLDTVLTLTGLTEEELREYSSVEILEMFIDGLVLNQILSLDSFCKRLGIR